VNKVFVFVAFVSFVAWAQTFPVDRLEIVGNENVSTAEILAKLPFKVGDTVDREKVLAGAKALEDMGYFAQVTPEVTVEEGKVVVRYRVVEYPKVKEIVIEGVSPSPRVGEPFGLGSKSGLVKFLVPLRCTRIGSGKSSLITGLRLAKS
jgi:outer membrane protein assembly factor BamA